MNNTQTIDELTLTVQFIVNRDAQEIITDCGLDKFTKPYGNNLLLVTYELPESLIESLSNDELIEFIGIDSEFLVYLNVKEF